MNLSIKYKKITLSLITLLISFSIPAYAEDNEPENESKAPIDTKDMGVYLLSKVVDLDTGEILKGVHITSSFENTITDENGEFLLKINPDESIIIKYKTYKETLIKVSSIKGKIKLEKIPKYIPLFPTAFFDINYINLGVTENYKNLSSTGRFNDSYSINAKGSLFNIFVDAGYESYKSELNRISQDTTKANEKQNFYNNTFYLKSGYIFNISEDVLSFSTGLKGILNVISTTSTVEPNPEDDVRDKDYLDIDHQKIGLGLDISALFRPVRYTPLVVGLEATYYPIYSVQKQASALLPDSLNSFDIIGSIRYDYLGITAQGKFIYKNTFLQDYNASLLGGSLGFGYGF